jgi:hypothetical protein
MSDIYALLIAVDFYFPDRLPNGSYYPHLGGCVRDVQHVETLLTTRFGVPADHILKLSATNVGRAQPHEPFEDWPTYANMVDRFQRLTAMARPGDQVYVHYSGHGGRTVTAYPQLKGENGLDEALVPTDIGKPQARYLRDVELAYLIQAMVDKDLRVIVVLDSCHSGGATRGPGAARVRGIDAIDTSSRPTESLVAPNETLVSTWQDLSGGATRSVKPASGWLVDPKGYTLFTACRANELAYEYPFNGKESNGALTYWLLDSLRQAAPGTSYKMLHDRILAKVHGKFDQQTPQLQGEGDWEIFGSDRIAPVYAAPVLKVEPAAGRVQINAGDVHGIQSGAHFAIYPRGASDLTEREEQIGLVEIAEVGDVDSWGAIVEESAPGAMAAGDQAVLQSAPSIRVQQGVAVPIADAALRQHVLDAISKHGKGYVVPVQESGQFDFQVTVNGDGEFELWDPAGHVVSSLHTPLPADGDGAATQLVDRLVHLARYRNVQELDAPDAQARQKLRVEVLHDGQPVGATPVFKPGDIITLRITNAQQPGTLNDAARMLNVSVLALDSDWSISQVYPAGAGLFEPLDPGQTLPLEFEAYLREGETANQVTFKIFATRETTSFRWLELPPLGQPATRAVATRGVPDDPLEQLLAALTGDESKATRAVRLRNAPKGWTMAQVALQVEA